MRINVLLPFLCLFLSISSTVLAQVPAQDSIDVLETRLQLAVDTGQNGKIAGKATLSWQTILAPTRQALHLMQSLTVDSVVYDGHLVSFNRIGELLYIYFAPSIPGPSPVHSTVVYYGGVPGQDPSWGGFYFQYPYAYDLGVGINSVPHPFGRSWFPCEDNFDERCSYSFEVLTDANRMAVCNGVQVANTLVPPAGKAWWGWQQTEAIPSYLVGLSVADYALVRQQFASIGGGQVPVVLAARPTDTTGMKQSFVHLQSAFNTYEQRYGPYAFSKVGYNLVPFNAGAMEHASNITYPLIFCGGNIANETTMAHELSHQWWGNLTTCANAEDMWLNEGFATFNEWVFLEGLYGKAAYDSAVAADHKRTLLFAHKADGFLPVSPMPQSKTYCTTTYQKGGLMAHSLRGLMGDSLFFEGCKAYFLQHHLDTASTWGLATAMKSKNPTVDVHGFMRDFVMTPGWIGLEADTAISVSGAAQVRVKTRGHWRPDSLTITSMPIEVGLFDSNAVYHEATCVLQLNNGAVMGLPFMPEKGGICLDPHNRYALARMAKLVKMPAVGNYPIPEADASIQMAILGPFDSIPRVHVSCEFGPDKLIAYANGGAPGGYVKLNPVRKWIVSTHLSPTMVGNIAFYFDGRANVGIDDSARVKLQPNASAGDIQYELYYREDEHKPWRTAAACGLNPLANYGANQSDNVLSCSVKLVPGQFCFGLKVPASLAKQIDTKTIHVFPNPNAGNFTVNLPKQLKKARVRLFDSAGKVVPCRVEELDFGMTYNVTTSAASGLYLLTIESGNTGKVLYESRVSINR